MLNKSYHDTVLSHAISQALISFYLLLLVSTAINFFFYFQYSILIDLIITYVKHKITSTVRKIFETWVQIMESSEQNNKGFQYILHYEEPSLPRLWIQLDWQHFYDTGFHSQHLINCEVPQHLGDESKRIRHSRSSSATELKPFKD